MDYNGAIQLYRDRNYIDFASIIKPEGQKNTVDLLFDTPQDKQKILGMLQLLKHRQGQAGAVESGFVTVDGREHLAGVAFLPFKKARAIVRKLKLRSQKEWKEWSKSERPANVPSRPHVVYRGAGWVSYPDWMGYAARTNGNAKQATLPAAAPMQRAASKKRKRVATEPPAMPQAAAEDDGLLRPPRRRSLCSFDSRPPS